MTIMTIFKKNVSMAPLAIVREMALTPPACRHVFDCTYLSTFKLHVSPSFLTEKTQKKILLKALNSDDTCGVIRLHPTLTN